MELSPYALEYIARSDLIGKANALAMIGGALASEHGSALPRCYVFTRPAVNPGQLISLPEFQIKRCDWDGGYLIEVKEGERVRFCATPLPYHKEATGPIVGCANGRHQIGIWSDGSWIPRLEWEYEQLTRQQGMRR